MDKKILRRIPWANFTIGIFGVHNFLFGDFLLGCVHILIDVIAILVPLISIGLKLYFDWGVIMFGLLAFNFVWSFIELQYKYGRKLYEIYPNRHKLFQIYAKLCRLSIIFGCVVIGISLLVCVIASQTKSDKGMALMAAMMFSEFPIAFSLINIFTAKSALSKIKMFLETLR